MIDKNARKILKLLIKSDKIQNLFTVSEMNKLFKNSKMSFELTQRAFNDLQDAKCIEKVSMSLNGQLYRLTNHGKMYFKSNWQNWIKSILNGIIFPTIVSLITTLLTIYLSSYQQNRQVIENQCSYKSDN